MADFDYQKFLMDTKDRRSPKKPSSHLSISDRALSDPPRKRKHSSDEDEAQPEQMAVPDEVDPNNQPSSEEILDSEGFACPVCTFLNTTAECDMCGNQILRPPDNEFFDTLIP
jgi:hypothetical protein